MLKKTMSVSTYRLNLVASVVVAVVLFPGFQNICKLYMFWEDHQAARRAQNANAGCAFVRDLCDRQFRMHGHHRWSDDSHDSQEPAHG